MGLGWTEIAVVVLIIVLFFGASKIPELARGVGEGINELKKAANDEIESDDNKAENTSNASREEVKS